MASRDGRLPSLEITSEEDVSGRKRVNEGEGRLAIQGYIGDIDEKHGGRGAGGQKGASGEKRGSQKQNEKGAIAIREERFRSSSGGILGRGAHEKETKPYKNKGKAGQKMRRSRRGENTLRKKI